MHPSDNTRFLSLFLQTLQPAAAAGSTDRHLGTPGLSFELAPVGRSASVALQPPECLTSGPPPQQLCSSVGGCWPLAPCRLYPDAHP